MFRCPKYLTMHILVSGICVRKETRVLESDTGNDELCVFDGRQSEAAAELQRGVCRAFRALGHSVVTELPLANGRRADVVAL